MTVQELPEAPRSSPPAWPQAQLRQQQTAASLSRALPAPAARRPLAGGHRPARGQLVVVNALIGRDDVPAVLPTPLDVLAHTAVAVGALVVAARELVPPDQLLPVLPPPVAVLQDVMVHVQQHHKPWLLLPRPDHGVLHLRQAAGTALGDSGGPDASSSSGGGPRPSSLCPMEGLRLLLWESSSGAAACCLFPWMPSMWLSSSTRCVLSKLTEPSGLFFWFGSSVLAVRILEAAIMAACATAATSRFDSNPEPSNVFLAPSTCERGPSSGWGELEDFCMDGTASIGSGTPASDLPGEL
eukprot:CAMPEP_0177613536 /NCGR_PEP_ID=MMETSP0419_2-20121207/22051_1 /TAXON_ID=582737 /ORGANISM="Tetraselmis sp., Strain GSL018" /LENGTH=297 /DNA_ID=CAMNT_0019110287 /DNA_START=923 /DNA_END=1818 /DNA_ORIENTATION=+